MSMNNTVTQFSHYLLKIVVFFLCFYLLSQIQTGHATTDLVKIAISFFASLIIAQLAEEATSRAVAYIEYPFAFPPPYVVKLPLEMAVDILTPVLSQHDEWNPYVDEFDETVEMSNSIAVFGGFMIDGAASCCSLSVFVRLEALEDTSTEVTMVFSPEIVLDLDDRDPNLRRTFLRENAFSPVVNFDARRRRANIDNRIRSALKKGERKMKKA